MATKKTALAKAAPQTTALATIDDELAKEVANIKNTIGQSSGNKIGVEAAGRFTLPSGEDLGDEIQVIVIDFVSHNKFYTTPFNSQNPAPPDCYAMGRAIKDMAPEADSPAAQSDSCFSCPMNAFGSGNNGRSKACQNRRMLAVLLVDPENPDAHNELDAPIYTLDLSPSNIKSFDGAVAAVQRSLNGPPIKATLTVRAKAEGTYASLMFTDPMPNPDYAAHFARRGEVQDQLFRKPDFAAYEAKAAAAAPQRRAAPRRAAPARR